MIPPFAIIQATILISLGLLHIYWALGGKWGFESSLPTNEASERILNPKKMDSTTVGIGLHFFAFF